jgi:hypothetical protein
MRKPHTNVPSVLHVGPHFIAYEPPDIVHIHYDGPVEVAHFKAFDAVVTSIPRPTRVYILRDGRKGGFVGPETRKYIAENVDVTRVAATVTYGSSFQTKTVSAMVNLALRRLNPMTGESVFFDTETEARAWIAAHRDALAGSFLESSRRA